MPFLNAPAGFGFAPAAGGALVAWLARADRRPSVTQTRQEALASIAGMRPIARSKTAA